MARTVPCPNPNCRTGAHVEGSNMEALCRQKSGGGVGQFSNANIEKIKSAAAAKLPIPGTAPGSFDRSRLEALREGEKMGTRMHSEATWGNVNSSTDVIEVHTRDAVINCEVTPPGSVHLLESFEIETQDHGPVIFVKSDTSVDIEVDLGRGQKDIVTANIRAIDPKSGEGIANPGPFKGRGAHTFLVTGAEGLTANLNKDEIDREPGYRFAKVSTSIAHSLIRSETAPTFYSILTSDPEYIEQAKRSKAREAEAERAREAAIPPPPSASTPPPPMPPPPTSLGAMPPPPEGSRIR